MALHSAGCDDAPTGVNESGPYVTGLATDSTDALDLRMPRAARFYEDLRSYGGGFVLALIGAAFIVFAPRPWGGWVGAGICTLAFFVTLVDVLFLNRFLQRYFRLRVVDGVLEAHTGRLLMTDVRISRNAILSVDLLSGPVLRHLGLARIKFNGIAAFPELPAFNTQDAEALQRIMTNLPTPEVRAPT